MLSEKEDELILSTFDIKHHGQRVNYQALYKSLVDVEFFRRLCFRIIEISDVKENWSYGYGRTCDKETAREVLRLKKEDIYFDQPNSMGIKGYDIGDDFGSVMRRLHLDKMIDVPKEQEILRQSVKVLKK